MKTADLQVGVDYHWRTESGARAARDEHGRSRTGPVKVRLTGLEKTAWRHGVSSYDGSGGGRISCLPAEQWRPEHYHGTMWQGKEDYVEEGWYEAAVLGRELEPWTAEHEAAWIAHNAVLAAEMAVRRAREDREKQLIKLFASLGYEISVTAEGIVFDLDQAERLGEQLSMLGVS